MKNYFSFYDHVRLTQLFLYFFEYHLLHILNNFDNFCIFLARDLFDSDFDVSIFLINYQMIFYNFLCDFWFYCIKLFIPSLALAVSRLHNIRKSGYWLFIVIVPLIELLI